MALTDFLGGDGGIDPISTRLPDNLTAFQNKYAETDFTGVPAPILSALQAFDAQRVQRGQQPLNAKQTTNALQAAIQGSPVTKPPKANPFNPKNVPGNVLSDLRNMLTAVPRIPFALVKEVGDIGKLPSMLGQISAGVNEQGEDVGVLAALAQAPGIRMLPGAYTVGNIAQGGQGIVEAARHPLMTALDLLPAASKLAGLTPVAKAARAAEVSAFEAGKLGATTLSPRPLKAVLTRSLDAEGNLVPNAVGRGIERAGSTQTGQMLRGAFGKESRLFSRVGNLSDRKLADWMYGTGELADDLDPALKQEITATRGAAALVAKYGDMGSEEMAATYKAMELGDLSGLGERQLELVSDARAVDSVMRDIVVKNGLKELDNELYPTLQADRILASQGSARRMRELANLKNDILNPTRTADELWTELNTYDPLIRDAKAGKMSVADKAGAELEGGVSYTQARLKVRGMLHALDAAGKNVDGLLNEFRTVKNADQLAEFLGSIRDTGVADLLDRPNVGAQEMLAALKSDARTQPIAARLTEAIEREDWSRAKKIADLISKRKTYRIDDVDGMIDSLKRNRERARFANGQLGQVSDRLASRLEKQSAKLSERTVPARYQAAVNKRVQDEMIAKYATPESREAVTKLVVEGRYAEVPGFQLKDLRDVQREIGSTWKEMRDAGVDPIFLHHVTPAQANQLRFPKAGEIAMTPGSLKARGTDITPHVKDVTVALTHQGMEFLARRASEEFIDTVATTWGKSTDDLMKRYADEARRMAEIEPRFDYQTHLDRLIKQEWTPFNPREQGYQWASKRLDAISGSGTYIPKSLADNLKRMHNPGTFRLTAPMDPVMKAFRTSLLPLSLRWHVNNIVGNGIMLMAGSSPASLKFIGQARKMVKEGTLPEELRLAAGGQALVEQELNYLSGRQMGKWMAKAQDYLNNGGALDRAKSAGGKVIQKSYDFNGMIDDIGKATAYLYGEDKALKKGMTREAAERAGLELTRNIFQQWTDLTPIERQIMRQVFPFYGFTQHILRFVMKYPFDHPMRAAVLGSITRAELADQGEGMPESMLAAMFFGGTAADGTRKAFQMSGFNPFRDTANYFTLAGFMSATNPVLSTIGESLGLKGGQADLYPNLHYDPATGKMALTAPNPLMALAFNTVPQSEIFASLLGVSKGFKQQMATDPDLAMRSLMNGMGIPVVLRNYNPIRTQFETELRLEQVQNEALNDAMKSGDYGYASRFPGLTDTIAKLQQMDASGELDEFKTGRQVKPMGQGAMPAPGASVAMGGSSGI